MLNLPGYTLRRPVRATDLAVALASTLAEIHLRGVIHKDIKPSNIIVTPSGEPRIIDFGAATLQRTEHVDAAPSYLLEGTLAYMFPGADRAHEPRGGLPHRLLLAGRDVLRASHGSPAVPGA